MTTIINPINKLNEKEINNYVLFTDENYNVFNVNASSILKDLKDYTKSINAKLTNEDFLTFNLNSKQTAILIKLKKNQSELENETKGASLYDFLKKNRIKDITFSANNIAKATQKKILLMNLFME